MCNNDTSKCNEPITAADGTVCSCQRAGGCNADGVECAGPSGPTPGPPPPPTPPPGPTPSPSPSGNCSVVAYGQCGGSHGCCEGTCTCAGAGTYQQCKPATGKWQC